MLDVPVDLCEFVEMVDVEGAGFSFLMNDLLTDVAAPALRAHREQGLLRMVLQFRLQWDTIGRHLEILCESLSIRHQPRLRHRVRDAQGKERVVIDECEQSVAQLDRTHVVRISKDDPRLATRCPAVVGQLAVELGLASGLMDAGDRVASRLDDPARRLDVGRALNRLFRIQGVVVT